MNNRNNNNNFCNKAKSPMSISTTYNQENHSTFNNSFGIPFKLSFTKYKTKEEKIKEKCWNSLTNFIILNYNSKKATKITNFGTFTYINSTQTKENSLYLIQNKFITDIPIFLVSNNFISYIKPGIYDDKNGLTLLSDKKHTINKNVEVMEVNYIKISKEINIPKEECEKIIGEIINDIKEKIKLQIFNAKKMDGLGIFLLRGNIFGMRFDNKITYNYNNNFFPNKICLKKNIFKLNKLKNEIENNKNKDLVALTDINSNLLFKSSTINPKNLKLKNKNNIIDNKIEENKSNNSLRNFSLIKLYNLKIKKDILEDIYNKKESLINNIINENNDNNFIQKENLIKCFLKINSSLDHETVNKIINIYNNENIENKIEYNNVITKLFNDIKKIIENKNETKETKEIKDTKNNSFSLDKKLPIIININQHNQKNENKKNKFNYNEEELYKLKKLIASYSSDNYVTLVSYKKISNFLKKNEIDIDSKKFGEMFDLKIENNEQLIDLNDCVLKLNKKIKRIVSMNIIENLNKKNLDSERDKLYMTNYINSLTDIGRYKSKLNINNMFLNPIKKEFNNVDNNIININNNEEIIIKLINLLKEKIYEEQKTQEKIIEYFDHLLSYNKNRKENIINLNEFQKVLKYENYNFSMQEILILFNYIDQSHKGYIDRLQFINAIKLIPFPLTIIQKYFKSNKLSVIDISFKMAIDIYNIPPENLLKKTIPYITFFSKTKSVDKEFDKNFIVNLFISLTGNINGKLSYQKMFENYNVYNKSSYTYLNIYENKDNINKIYTNILCNNIPFSKLKEKLFSADIKSVGKLSYNDFCKVINSLLKEKILAENFIHLLRINNLINTNDEIDYINFLRFIDSKYPDDSFIECLKYLAEFLDKECNRDIFIFTIKVNNMNNNSTSNEIISPERLYYIFKEKNEYLKFEVMKKFDYNDDGIITVNDIKNTILKYYDNHFFDNKKTINENNKKEEENKMKKIIFNFYLYIKDLLEKNNLNINGFFLYLDKNKDELIDKEEFTSQLLSLKYFENEKFNQNEIEIFFNFLDKYKNNKINIDLFQNKFRFLKEELDKQNNDGYFDEEKKSDFILEDLILNELCIWYKDNKYLYTEEEIFSMMDKDNDGIISKEDFKSFINEIFFISKNESFDKKISNFLHIISLNKDNNNISLSDFQHLIDCINKNDLKKYKEDILVNYIKGKNNIWIKYVINELKIQINQKYGSDIEKMYNEFNIHNYQNQGQGLSFGNFELFIFKNFGFFENYHLDKNELLQLFNYISNNKKFINLNDLKNNFTLINNNLNTYDNKDFYENMHKIIKKFINENFPISEDAFLFFQTETDKKLDKKIIKDFITIKEFYNGINSLFPKKYETETILNYYQKIFKTNLSKEKNININGLKVIKYNEFKDIYYKTNILGTIYDLKKRYNLEESPNKKSKRNIISYSVDKKYKKNSRTIIITPIEKMKRILQHSEKEKKRAMIYNYINETQRTTLNRYQFYNLIKKLDLGLSNNEIEDIIDNEGLFCDGFVDLFKFHDFIFKDDYNLEINKKHIEEKLSEIKDLIVKYYTSPLLAFELNIKDKTNNYLNFEYFKNLIYLIYTKEKKNLPSYPILKSIFDYIDYKKDGIISTEEWCHIFSNVNGYLDIDNLKNGNNVIRSSYKNINLKEWENSSEIIQVFKLICKNRKLIREKFKLFSVDPSCLLIHTNDLINILKEILYSVNLTNEQWKIIVNIGKKGKSEFVDFKTFSTIIEYASKVV